MKRITLVLLAFLPFLATAQEKIMVIADPHVFPQTEIAKESNFDDYMAKQRKMVDLSEPIWHALMDTALAYHPSLVLIPGDLTRDGEPAAHDTVSAALNRLQQAGIRTLVIPGNHDLPETVDWLNLYPGTFENAVRDLNSFSYAVEPLRGVTVIGIDGSNGNAGTGVIKPGTLRFILAQADSATAKGHTIIAMSHWQILEHFDQQGTLESACRFKEADALRDSLMAHGVHVVLTGHFHVNSISTFRDTTGLTSDSLVEISTGSPITYPCPYRWLTISQDKANITVETAYLTAVDTISDLYGYSRAWMAEHTYNMIPSLALRAWGKVDSKWDSTVVPALTAAGINQTLINMLKNALPQTDEDRIAITERNLGAPAVSLYLFHSDGNENEDPERGQALADSVYAGMRNMVNEALGMYAIALGNTFGGMAVLMAEEPVQSMVEDMTNRASILYADVTNDLHLTLTVNAPQNFDGVEQAEAEMIPVKLIQKGQLLIRRGAKIYNANGQQIVH